MDGMGKRVISQIPLIGSKGHSNFVIAMYTYIIYHKNQPFMDRSIYLVSHGSYGIAIPQFLFGKPSKREAIWDLLGCPRKLVKGQ